MPFIMVKHYQSWGHAFYRSGEVVVVLKMILIWEFRVVGILIRGGDDTHEREIKKKFVFN